MPAEQVRQHVEEILRPQCAHLSPTEFEDLVNSVVGSKVVRAIMRSTPKRGVLAPVDLPEFPLPIPTEGIEIRAEQA
jgi:hypothetical protein